jgi:hypothetical protein
MQLVGILKTVVYCTTANEQATRRFYREVLGLQPLIRDHEGDRMAFRPVV